MLNWLFNLNTNKWLEELSFGSNFGNLRAIGSNQFYCYFLVHLFPRYSKVVKNFIRLQLRKSSCVRIEIFAVSIPSIHLSNKKATLNYLYRFLSFSVHNFCARTDGLMDGRTDRHFLKKFYFFLLIKNIYTYIDYFSNFTPILTKVSIPFSIWKQV